MSETPTPQKQNKPGCLGKLFRFFLFLLAMALTYCAGWMTHEAEDQSWDMKKTLDGGGAKLSALYRRHLKPLLSSPRDSSTTEPAPPADEMPVEEPSEPIDEPVDEPVEKPVVVKENPHQVLLDKCHEGDRLMEKAYNSSGAKRNRLYQSARKIWEEVLRSDLPEATKERLEIGRKLHTCMKAQTM